MFEMFLSKWFDTCLKNKRWVNWLRTGDRSVGHCWQPLLTATADRYSSWRRAKNYDIKLAWENLRFEVEHRSHMRLGFSGVFGGNFHILHFSGDYNAPGITLLAKMKWSNATLLVTEWFTAPVIIAGVIDCISPFITFLRGLFCCKDTTGPGMTLLPKLYWYRDCTATMITPV